MNDAEYVEGVVDALDHIARVCRGSRTRTRRLRWIELRAESAINGNSDWREADLPKHDPRAEKLEAMIECIYPVALLSAAPLAVKFVADVKYAMPWIPRRYKSTETPD